MSTQIAHVRRHLMDGKSITPAIAMTVYGISRLASAIEDLRREGMVIDTVLKRDEMGKQYGEYRMRRDITDGDQVQIKPGHGIGLPHWVKRLRNAVVLQCSSDAALVRFVRGKNETAMWLNHKELVRAD